MLRCVLLPLVLLFCAFACGQDGRLEQLVTGDNIIGHLSEFERIANLPENQGSRAVYLGYNHSAMYVISRLTGETDLLVWTENVPVTFSVYLETPTLSLVKPISTRYDLKLINCAIL